MHERTASSAPRGETVSDHFHNGVEIGSCQPAIRPCPAHEREQLIFGIVGARRLGDDLLCQHVERRLVRHDAIELAASHRAQQRRAFDEIVARYGEEPTFRHSCNRVTGAADALQQRGDAMRRSDLADQVDVSDVDTQLQRCRCHQRFQLTVLQPILGIEPLLFREAAVMRSDGGVADAVAEMTSQSLGHAPRVDEDQRRAMRADQFREPVVILLPHFVGHHRLQRRARDFQREIHRPAVAFVDDLHRQECLCHIGCGPDTLVWAPHQIFRHFFDRVLRGRKSYSV